MRSTRTATRNGLGAGLAVAALTLAGLAPAAQAAPDDPFTPQFGYSTSTDQAGAHPDITVELHKQVRNHCLDPAAPTRPDNPCILQYIEQNPKTVTMHFPPGAVSDANAAPYCDLRKGPLFPFDVGLPDVYSCTNEGALVGVVDATAQWCGLYLFPKQDPTSNPQIAADGCTRAFNPDGTPFGEGFCADPQVPPVDDGYTYECRSLGYVYNEAPRTDERGRPTEQGHLVVLFPRWRSSPDCTVETTELCFDPADPSTYDVDGARYGAMLATHISVRVRKGDLGIDSVAELPDAVPLMGSAGGLLPLPAQVTDMTLTLFGDTGAERGHALITNPTFCEPQSVGAEMLGYAENSRPEDPEHPLDRPYVPGSGDGKMVSASVGVQARDCDRIPYNPKLDLRLESTQAGEAPAISATVTQKPDEATTGKTTVTFPKAFKINDKNTATHCPEELIQATVGGTGDCPESSRIGTAKASSHVLPEGETVNGNVYLAGLTGDSIKISAILHGFIDVRIDAQGKLGGDLTLINDFDNLPAVPIGQFDLNLEGGDKGLIKNPRVCGPQTIASSFTSHSGKVVGQETPVDIVGCSDPTLDVELSNPRKGKPTDLDASVSSTGTSIESVDLRLDRHLKWGKRKARKGKKQLARGGSATFDTLGGQKVVPLKAKATKRGGLVFGPLTTGRQGQQVATAVPGFTATLTRARGQRARTARRDLSAFFRKSTVGMSGLPGDDPTGVDLNLLGQGKNRPIYLKNPLGCKKPLNFVAIVKTKRGATLALKDQVRLRGKGCRRR